ncbi:serine/threonine-protein phosphatase 4 regulatory subunit 1-like isoform X2 [Chelonus insularis]|nr:serine/threonine-protein phosphatase 4 regulatory subunit 1-like isoform X2 [Chelonus insularis]XP_034947614.1 serine/threonine-protein phosphatase 4 regulatory subunit 1-like isoform X2 [Chelonus insularis]
MQPVHKLVYDTDANVRLELVEQLPHVAMICQEAPERFGDVLSNHLIHIIVSFHHDADQQVRQSTHAALLALIERGLLVKESIENVVAPTLLMMTQDPSKLEYFNFALDGMSKVAPLLDPKTAERLFLGRYLSLCCDVNFFIRKLCAINFGEFSAAMTKETMYEKLLPMYIKLCNDKIWTVRKSCAEVMVSVACCVSLEHRRTTLAQILANYLEDESKWVRLSAYQILGPFISTFAKRFTGFAYNQYGELVLTDQHGTELRYNMISVAESASPLALCRMVVPDDPECADSDAMVFGLATKVKDEDKKERKEKRDRREKSSGETNKENVPLNRTTSWCDSTETDDSSTEDYHQFNSFLYYYISPDLPLDNDLIESIKNDSKTSDASGSTEKSINGDQNHDSEITVPLIVVSNSEQRNKVSSRTEETTEQSLKSSDVDQKCSESEDSHIRNQENIDGDESINSQNCSTSEAWNHLNDTVNVSSLSSDPDNSTSLNTTIVTQSIDENGQTIVPQILINFFVSMADPSACWDLTWGSIEIPRYCAFYFPAVVLTLGKENWPMLKTAYKYLSDAREYKVRRTMASSIHEVAMILGEELSAQDLLPIYDGFIKDLDEVRIGALKHLATFLMVLKPEDRCQFLPRLEAFLSMDNEWNWRFRKEVACKLLETIPLYGTSDVSKHIVPLSFTLLCDKVAAVRHVALNLVTQIFSYLSNDEELSTAIIKKLRLLLVFNESRWNFRQTFALLCASLITKEAISGEKFAKTLLPELLEYSKDAVPNVRLVVVRTLTTQVVNIRNCLSEEQIEKINNVIKMMKHDPDRDVRAIAGGIVGKYRGFK